MTPRSTRPKTPWYWTSLKGPAASKTQGNTAKIPRSPVWSDPLLDELCHESGGNVRAKRLSQRWIMATLTTGEPKAFRSPSLGQAKYPALKTHMLEHHWLQARRAECNPSYTSGTYGGCEPYYFNHCWESNPATLFYDGHTETVGTRKAERADGRVQAQSGVGLWCRSTPWGLDGYNIGAGYDFADTSFHVLTTQGIKGRDILAD